jgi:hypothetical protein
MINPHTLVMIIVAMLFFLGMATFLTGVLILATRASSSDIKAIAKQTRLLAQKGIAEDVAGLVGNATNLVDAMNQLVRTTRGVGFLLCALGMILMGASCWIALQFYQMQP